MGEIILSLKDFQIFKTSPAINATFNHGEITAIFGSNGAGKTMIVKSIASIYKYFDGEIFRNYKDDEVGILLQLPEDLIFREYAIDEAMMLTDNLTEAEKLLHEIGAEKSTYALDLSDGQKRLLFLYGLMRTKNILIFDEPFASIDHDTKNDIMKKMLECKQLGKSIIYTANRKTDLLVSDKVIYI